MKLLYDLFPLVLFFAAYSLWDIYVATATAMAASVLQVGYYWFRYRTFETMQVATLVIILLFGGLTLYMQDATFIKWKPTLVYWFFALAILVSLLSEKSLIQRVFGEQFEMVKSAWLKLNIVWAAFFVFLGFLNLYVAFYFGSQYAPDTRERIWVYFKFPGMFILLVLFIFAQVPYLSNHMKKPEAGNA